MRWYDLVSGTRLRDLPDQTLYCARSAADYGPLQRVLRRRLRAELIVAQWEELVRLAASLRDGLVAPSLLVAKLQGLRRQSGLQHAIQELGRLAKTRHVLAFVDDERLRRRVFVGLNRQESIHAMPAPSPSADRGGSGIGATRRSSTVPQH